jgi:hypothetical protein
MHLEIYDLSDSSFLVGDHHVVDNKIWPTFCRDHDDTFVRAQT